MGTVVRRAASAAPDQDADAVGDMSMLSPLRMIWVNPIEQRKYQTIHAWIGPST
jgi:hypothetical protein